MRIRLTILILSSLSAAVTCAAPPISTESPRLLGMVHTVSMVTTIAGRDGERVVSRYDPHGYEAELLRYTSDGLLVDRADHTYNDKGLRIETTTKNAADELLARTLYLYDLQGQLNEKTTLDSVGIIDKTTYTYDTNTNTVEETTTYTHRAITVRVTRWYDAKGRETQTVTIGRGGSVTKTIFAYDAKGNMTERRVYTSDGALLDHLRYTYEFDTVGNWIAQTELLCSSPGDATAEACAPTAVVTQAITYAGQKNVGTR